MGLYDTGRDAFGSGEIRNKERSRDLQLFFISLRGWHES